MTQSQLIASNILKTRERLNVTQDYMADALGMSQAGYGKLERGETNISTDRLKQVADAMGVCFSTLWPFDSAAYMKWDVDKIMDKFAPRTFEDCQKVAHYLAIPGEDHHNLLFALFNRLPTTKPALSVELAD